MPAYLISLCRQVTDRKNLENYWANGAPAFKDVKAKPLVAYTSIEVLEGDSSLQGVVLFEFSSMEEVCGAGTTALPIRRSRNAVKEQPISIWFL